MWDTPRCPIIYAVGYLKEMGSGEQVQYFMNL